MMDNKTHVPMSVQELFAELKAHKYKLERMCNKASVSVHFSKIMESSMISLPMFFIANYDE